MRHQPREADPRPQGFEAPVARRVPPVQVSQAGHVFEAGEVIYRDGGLNLNNLFKVSDNFFFNLVLKFKNKSILFLFLRFWIEN